MACRSQPPGPDDVLAPGGTFLDDDFRAAEPAIEALVAAGITQRMRRRTVLPGRNGHPGADGGVSGRALKAGTSDVAAILRSGGRQLLRGLGQSPVRTGGCRPGIPTGHSGRTLPVSRAEMAALLVRAGPRSPGDVGPSFIDVPADAWFAPFVEALRAAGITTGLRGRPFLSRRGRSPGSRWLCSSPGLSTAAGGDPGPDSPLNGLPATGLAMEGG